MITYNANEEYKKDSKDPYCWCCIAQNEEWCWLLNRKIPWHPEEDGFMHLPHCPLANGPVILKWIGADATGKEGE